MIRRITGSLVALTLLVTSVAWAHEGHERKLMGTVTMVAADHVIITTTDGKAHTISLKDTTKVKHGTMAMKTADLKKGTRVVITATGDKEPYTAKEINVGAAAKPVPPARVKK